MFESGPEGTRTMPTGVPANNHHDFPLHFRPAARQRAGGSGPLLSVRAAFLKRVAAWLLASQYLPRLLFWQTFANAKRWIGPKRRLIRCLCPQAGVDFACYCRTVINSCSSTLQKLVAAVSVRPLVVCTGGIRCKFPLLSATA